MTDFVDSNVLLYSISSDPAEVQKRNRALQILQGQIVLSVQVLQEFYANAIKPGNGVSRADAMDLVRAWQRFRVIETTVPLMQLAIQINMETNFHYWDCAIIAAAQLGGCNTLMTEDMNAGQWVGEVQIVNPFHDI